MLEKWKDPLQCKNMFQYGIGKVNVWFMLLVFPILLRDKLNNVTVTRYMSFSIVASVCIGCVVLNEVVYLIRRKLLKNNEVSKDKAEIKDSTQDSKQRIHLLQLHRYFNNGELIAIAGMLLAVLAYLVSPYKRYALTGVGNRYIGMFFILAILSEFLTVSICYQLDHIDIDLAALVGFFVNLLAVLNYCDIDPWGFLKNLTKAQKLSFISTMGNVDVYGVYAVIITSLSIYLMLTGKKKWERIWYLLSSIMGMMGVIACGSDAAFLGMFIFYIVLFYKICTSFSHISDWFLTVLMFCLSQKVLECLRYVKVFDCRRYQGIFRIVEQHNSIWLIIVLFVMVLIFRMLKKTWNEPFGKETCKRIRIIYLAALVLFVISLFITVLIDTNKYAVTSVTGLTTYFVFNDSWGSGRGFIWKNLMEGYLHMPFINKIFGMGHASIASVLSYQASAHWNLLNGLIVDNAHNIYLHLLITTGIAGLATFIALVVSSIRNKLQSMKQEVDHNKRQVYTAIEIAVICALIQCFFCLLESITFPIVICLLAILNHRHGKVDEHIRNIYRNMK